jgi:hypothetical protein
MSSATDAHDLLPDSLRPEIPPLYGTEQQADPLARIKLFTPDSNWTALYRARHNVVEYSPEERLCFGLVIGHEREMGHFLTRRTAVGQRPVWATNRAGSALPVRWAVRHPSLLYRICQQAPSETNEGPLDCRPGDCVSRAFSAHCS